jgi:hypothetical protein
LRVTRDDWRANRKGGGDNEAVGGVAVQAWLEPSRPDRDLGRHRFEADSWGAEPGPAEIKGAGRELNPPLGFQHA